MERRRAHGRVGGRGKEEVGVIVPSYHLVYIGRMKKGTIIIHNELIIEKKTHICFGQNFCKAEDDGLHIGFE